VIHRLPWFALLLLGCSDCHESPTPPATEAPEAVAIDLDDPSTCAACHAAVVEEWRESMHAHAHPSEDPIYAAMRSLRMERQGAQVARKCGSCHHPLANDTPDAPLATTGVSCRSCHGVAHVREGAGHAALVWTEDRLLRGPHDLAPDASPVHGTGPAAPHLTDGRTLCLACHREARNPEGVVTCNTGNELADTEASCTSCHMPEVNAPSGSVSTRPTHRSHVFVGPHAAWSGDDGFLRGAVAMRAELGSELVVTLENRSGHAFPTGFPGRFAVLQAIAKDASGAEIWRAWREDPSEAPQAMLNQVYLDADGEPTMAPFASSIGRDTRLRANETREVRFAVPAEATEVSVTLRFFLIAPKAARALGLAEAPEATPRVVAEARATR
jgi:hypothetical protein